MNTTKLWYSALKKPAWAPPSWLFGPVWAVLYILIALSYGTVLYKIVRGELPKALALPLILNLAFNLAYSPIQFGLHNNYLALVDILLILGTLIWSILAVYPYLAWAALMNVPYLLWVSFAAVLQISITWLNR